MNHLQTPHTSAGWLSTATSHTSSTHSHVVERDPHSVGEVFAEERDLGIALAEVVQHDEVCVHLHADVDGLGGRAVRANKRRKKKKSEVYVTLLSDQGCISEREHFCGNIVFLQT